MSKTRNDSYKQLGNLTSLHSKVLGAITANGPMTRRELAAKTGIQDSSVCARVNELVEKSALQIVDTKLDTKTNRRVNLYGIPQVYGPSLQAV